MKTVLILQLGNLNSAPRIYRTFIALKGHFNICTAGYNSISMEGETFIDLSAFQNVKEPAIDFHLKYPLPVRKIVSLFINLFVLRSFNRIAKFKKLYWTKQHREVEQYLKAYKFDILIAHGIDVLPIAYNLCKASGAKLVFNAHEYYPREFEENKEWLTQTQPLYDHLCKTYLPMVDLFITVSENIRKEYLLHYKRDSVVITNAGEYKDLPVKKCNEQIKIVHHGAALRGRNIETMIRCVESLDDRFSMDLMLVPADHGYYEELKNSLNNFKKVKLIEPVEFRLIPEFLNRYDIGLYILPVSNFNNEMALPNKFFEFIQARLMLAISPNPEMALLTKKYGLGIVSPDYSTMSMAKELNKLTIDAINNFKANTKKAAEEMNAEKNSKLILDEVKNLCAA